MSRYFVASVFVGVLFVAPISANDPNPKPVTLESVAAKQKELTSAIELLTREIAALRERVDRSDAARMPISEAFALGQQMAELKNEIARLKSDLEAARVRESRSSPLNSPRDTNIPPTPTDSAEVLRSPVKGYFRILNRFPTSQRIMVEGSTIVVRGFETVDIPVDAGVFTFQWLDSLGVNGMARQRVMTAGKTYSITLTP